MALIDKLTDIANAIRVRAGTSTTYTLAEMPAAITTLDADEALAGLKFRALVSDRTVIEEITAADLEGVTDVRKYAFANASIQKIVFPASVMQIQSYACKSSTVKEVVITGGDPATTIVSIYDGAFQLCTQLRAITLPSTVYYIGPKAFDGCMNLSDVYFKGTAAQWRDITISSGNDALTNATIHFNS
jgi:hypothetical protein